MHKPRRNTAANYTERDAAIVDHVVRFRLSTNEVVARLFFRGQGPAAVRKVMARLCANRQLNQFELKHPRVYYTLGKRAAAERGLPPHRTWPLGPQSLAMEYAVLAYATLGSRYHRRLTREELASAWPWPASEQGEPTCCVDDSPQGPVLELLRVDLGARADHVARKCERMIDTRRSNAKLDNVIRDGRLRLVVITAAESKAAAIRRSLGKHIWPAGLEIHIAVVRQLAVFSKGGAPHA